jgi:hypothetical protein
MEFDAWTIAGVAGGSAALSYLATGWKQVDGKQTLRLSLDGSGSLLGDVRVLGGALTAVAAWYMKGEGSKKTRHTLQAVAAASFLSVLQTEVVRWRLNRANVADVAKDLPLFPTALVVNGGVRWGGVPAGQPATSRGAWARS